MNILDTRDRLLDEVGNIRVSRAVRRDDWVADAIYDIAAGDKKNWTVLEWQAVLSDLTNCKLKISDWLEVS